jgi:hypothetical protein
MGWVKKLKKRGWVEINRLRRVFLTACGIGVLEDAHFSDGTQPKYCCVCYRRIGADRHLNADTCSAPCVQIRRRKIDGPGKIRYREAHKNDPHHMEKRRESCRRSRQRKREGEFFSEQIALVQWVNKKEGDNHGAGNDKSRSQDGSKTAKLA